MTSIPAAHRITTFGVIEGTSQETNRERNEPQAERHGDELTYDDVQNANLMRVVDRIGIHREIEPFLNVPASLLACLGLTVVGYRVSTGFPEGTVGVTHHVLGVGLSTLMIGLFLMVTRKKAISQVLALLTVENAIFLIALGITSGMPLVVELGIFFDVILAVLVLGILVRRIVDRFESMDVSRLSNLKG